MVRKALLRGASTWLQPTCGAASVAKALVAVPVYLFVLPFALLAGHHYFVTLLVSMFDHLGMLLALVGINPVREQYVTE